MSFKTQSANSNTGNNGSNITKVIGLKATMKNTTVSLKWNKINGAAGYEIDLNVPGVGHIPMYTTNN